MKYKLKAFIKYFAFIMCGVLGGAVVWITQGHTFLLMPGSMSYSDLVSILLTAVSLIVGIFGVVMAILAIWGYSHFKSVVEEASKNVASEIATKTAQEQTENDLKSGGKTREFISNIVAEYLNNQSWKENTRAEIDAMNELDALDALDSSDDISNPKDNS